MGFLVNIPVEIKDYLGFIFSTSIDHDLNTTLGILRLGLQSLARGA